MLSRSSDRMVEPSSFFTRLGAIDEPDSCIVHPGKETTIFKSKSQTVSAHENGYPDGDGSATVEKTTDREPHSKHKILSLQGKGSTKFQEEIEKKEAWRSLETETEGSHSAAAPLAALMNLSQLHRVKESSQQSFLPQTGTTNSQLSSRLPLSHNDNNLSAVSSPTSASAVQTSHDVSDIQYVEDSDLLELSKEALFSQCLLRGELQRASEKHEIELGNTLNSRDKEIETLKGEKKKLLEEIDDLSKENAKLKSKRLTIQPKTEAQSLEILTEPVAGAVQMITILFTSKLQDFKIWKIIAHGCEGAVFLAESLHQGSNLLTGKRFALKVLFNVFGHSTFTQVRNFYQTEYQALCAMPPHPNIIRLYAFFYDRINTESLPDLPPAVAENARMLSLFLVMEHIPRTLEQEAAALRKEGKLTAKQVMKWSLDIFTAIQHLLDNHFVHRDLKLNNVLVTDKGMLKICDFGCSIQLSDNMNMLYSPGSSLGGNPAHIPPELLNAQAGNMVECGSQDLWASGVMVYEMACGVSPFWDLDQRGYRMPDLPELRIKNEKGSEVDVVFPVEFSEMVKLILEFEPSNRPQVQEVIAVTRKLVETD